jgi:RHS repeat-associated protein
MYYFAKLSCAATVPLLLLCSYAGGAADVEYFPSPDSAQGWRTLTDAASVRKIAGMDLSKLDQAFEYAQRSSQHGGLLVARHGWLVYEKYYGRGNREAIPAMASVGKAYTSIACGIMLRDSRDKIPDGLDQKVFNEKYLPEALPLNDPLKADIRLGHLLSMAAGFHGDGTNPGFVNFEPSQKLAALPVPAQPLGQDQAALQTPLWTAPGGGYSYASSSPHVASIVLRHIVGMEMQEYIDQKLAKPMAWGRWGYAMHRGESTLPHTPGGGDIAVRSTDSLRFAYLLLHQGRWGEQQLVPSEYVAMCGRPSPYQKLTWYQPTNNPLISNDNGNLWSASYQPGGPGISNTSPFTETFNYDGVNRLTLATDSGGWSRGFTYDAFGNMTPSGNPAPPTESFNSNNQIVGGSYDQAGNQLSVNGNTFQYDFENHIISETESGNGGTETYVYDGNGHRVEKYGATGRTVFAYDALGRMAAEYSLSVETPACVTCYLSPDHLGTARLVTDQYGNVVGRHDYLPFGEEVAANTFGRNGQWGSGNDSINEKFTGKERDTESGLDYFGARYYGSALGRFSSPDPENAGAFPSNPQSWNAYAYVGNNPLTVTDPDGRDWSVCESNGSNCATVTNDAAFDQFNKNTGNYVQGGNYYDSSGNQIGTASWSAPNTDLAGAAMIGRTSVVANDIALGFGVMSAGFGGGIAYGAVAGGPLIGSLGIAGGPLVGFGLTPQSQEWATEMIEAGHKVQAIPTDPLKKTADFVVDGVVTEYKGLTSSGPTTIKNAIEKAVKQSDQSIVIDARRTTASASEAFQQVQRAVGNIGGNLQGRITVLTKDGSVKY